MKDDGLFEYIGNIHIHSTFSDGTKTVSEIARIAADLDLDFIIITDHDYLTDSLHLEQEGFCGKTLVLMGLEIGERFHHYLAFNLNRMIRTGDSHPQEIIDQVNAQGGFGFLAHPFEKGMPFVQKSIAYTWNDLTVSDFTGICVWAGLVVGEITFCVAVGVDTIVPTPTTAQNTMMPNIRSIGKRLPPDGTLCCSFVGYDLVDGPGGDKALVSLDLLPVTDASAFLGRVIPILLANSRSS